VLLQFLVEAVVLACLGGLIGLVSAATPEWPGRLSLVREYLSTSTPEAFSIVNCFAS